MVRQGSFYIYIVHIYIRALLPYDCRSCKGCHHQYVFTNIVFIIFFIFDRGKYKHIVLIIKANLSFFSYENFFLKVLLFMADTIIYYKKRKERTMKRKHLITIGVIIAIVLLLYWLFIAEDLNAWLNVN